MRSFRILVFVELKLQESHKEYIICIVFILLFILTINNWELILINYPGRKTKLCFHSL